MRWQRQQALKKTPMSAGSVVAGCLACGARMVASGIAASISSIVETCYLPARAAAQPCRAALTDRQKFDAHVAPAIPPVQNAKMAGWWSAPALTGVSSVVSGIRPAWANRRCRQSQVSQASRSQSVENSLRGGWTLVSIPNRDGWKWLLSSPPALLTTVVL